MGEKIKEINKMKDILINDLRKQFKENKENAANILFDKIIADCRKAIELGDVAILVKVRNCDDKAVDDVLARLRREGFDVEPTKWRNYEVSGWSDLGVSDWKGNKRYAHSGAKTLDDMGDSEND